MTKERLDWIGTGNVLLLSARDELVAEIRNCWAELDTLRASDRDRFIAAAITGLTTDECYPVDATSAAGIAVSAIAIADAAMKARGA